MAEPSTTPESEDRRDPEAARSSEEFDQVYQELRTLARARLKSGLGGQTLQATALVHEAWIKITSAESESLLGTDPARFYALAARAMRFLLVDHARRRGANKRGGGERSSGIDPDEVVVDADEAARGEILQLDAALEKLSQVDERKAQVVLLRHFAGLSVEETARSLGLSPATVKREWSFARAWLEQEILESRNA